MLDAQLTRACVRRVRVPDWEWTYAVLKMIKLFTILTMFAHWQACIWGFVSS